MSKERRVYYYATECAWTPGAIVSHAMEGSPQKTFFLPDVPAQYANVEDYLARRKTELRLEEYRLRECPHFPSRRDAIFLNLTPDDAQKWRSRGARSNCSIYELLPFEEHNSHEANLVWYNYCVRLEKNPAKEFRRIFGDTPETEFSKSLEAYWQNMPSEGLGSPSQLEILYIGTLEVVRRVA